MSVPAPKEKIGVLLINLGTPDSPEPGAIRAYLREFLSDARVVEIPWFIWQPILRCIILPTRPRRSAHAYRQIWTDEGSPLAAISARQTKALQGAFGPDVEVDLAMRYGSPSIGGRVDALRASGCTRILLAPLYPQYCAATTATACDEVFRALARMRFQPAVRIAPPYYNDPVYVEALGSSAGAELSQLAFKPDVILASFHGVPKAYVDNGDPYYAQCVETTRLLRERLNLDESKLMMTFQSRFGRGKWLEPATNRTIRKLAKDGVKNLAVITPGFAADCLETLEEITIENARLFKKFGGENFAALPCLNDSAPGMLVIWQMALRELKGWV